MTETALYCSFPFCRLKDAHLFFRTRFGDFISWLNGKHSLLPIRDGVHFPRWNSWFYVPSLEYRSNSTTSAGGNNFYTWSRIPVSCWGQQYLATCIWKKDVLKWINKYKCGERVWRCMEEAKRKTAEKCNEKWKWQDGTLGDAGGHSIQITSEKALSQNSHLRGCCIKNTSG